MKLCNISDLHLDSHSYSSKTFEYDLEILIQKISDGLPDVVINTGDCFHIHPSSDKLQRLFNTVFIEELKRLNIEYMYVKGNHDFYFQNYLEMDNQNFTKTIDNVTFINTPLYYPILKYHTNVGHVLTGLNDFRYINGLLYNYKFIQDLYIESLNFITKTISNTPENNKIVLSTHYGISHKSISEQFRGNFLNDTFCNDLEHMFYETIWKRINYVFHGHVHSKHDYMINNTRVIVNPLGYYHERSLYDYEPVFLEV